jgi:hypothetical protein
MHLLNMTRFIYGFFTFALSFWSGAISMPAKEGIISREAALNFLKEQVQQHAVAATDATAQLQSPKEHAPFLEALRKWASDKPDPELIDALLNYILMYRSPENPLPALVLGHVFVEQPDAVLAQYRGKPALERLALLPYLNFGYQKAVDGKNPSLPRLVEIRKKWDLLQADSINARARDDVKR